MSAANVKSVRWNRNCYLYQYDPLDLLIEAKAMKGTIRPFRILIIEDDADILNALNIVLGSEGFDVDVLLRGQNILNNQFVKPDLFILDYRLPDTDGLAVCHHLKSTPNYRDVPIIVISASPKLKQKVLEAGASAFIDKPFDVSELVNLVSSILHGQTDGPDQYSFRRCENSKRTNGLPF